MNGPRELTQPVGFRGRLVVNARGSVLVLPADVDPAKWARCDGDLWSADATVVVTPIAPGGRTA